MPTKKTGKIRKALVTGGAKGYGYGIAQALAKAGYQVWITGRDPQALNRAARKLDVTAIQADVTSTEDWDRVFSAIDPAPGKFEVLVNNAGAGIHIAPAVQQTDAEIDLALSVNLNGAIYGCRRAAPRIVKAGGGTIVNISSVCARQAWAGWSTYSAAKAGLEQFAKCLYLEHREQGLRVTSLAPSWGATQFGEAADLGTQEAEISKRSIQPKELGKIVADICALPSHLFVQDMVLWPTIQPVEPL
jgi:NAD(P)-dependent dehydrogenase (short-subunit alcohol dehydrogenase family)